MKARTIASFTIAPESRAEDMLATTFETRRASQFHTERTCGDLVLRVCNPPRRGQVVRLRSSKCTIGSGPQCTLRLRASGVAPLHCLILRGASATVVRRWASDTRLNAHAFEDALLMAGDRLSIGPVELEVVSVGAVPFREERKVEQKPAVDLQIEQTEAAKRQVEEDRRRLDATADEFHKREGVIAQQETLLASQESSLARQTALLSEREVFLSQKETGLSEREDFLSQKEKALSEREDGLAQKETTLLDRESGLAQKETLLETREGSLSQKESELSEREDSLSQKMSSLSGQEGGLIQKISLLSDREGALAQKEASLREQEGALAQKAASLTEQEIVLSRQAVSLVDREKSLVKQADGLQSQLKELEKGRQLFDEQRRQWQIEQDEAQHRIEEQRSQVVAKLKELEQKKSASVEEGWQMESQRNEVAAQAIRQMEELQSQLGDLDQQRQSLEEQRRQWQAETADVRRQLDEQWGELDSRRRELDEQGAKLEIQRRDLEKRTAELDSQRIAIQDERSALERRELNLLEKQRELEEASAQRNAEPVAEPVAEAKPQEPEFESPKEEAPVNLADIFRRLGAKVDMEEEPEAKTPTLPLRQPLESLRPSPVADAMTESADEEQHEESINDYMSQLFQRVRSSSSGSGPAYVPASASSDQRKRNREATEAVAPPPAVEESKPETLEERLRALRPRAAAPERHIDLSALRELANLSAHNALGRYSRKVLISHMHDRLIVAIVALIASGVLFWLWNSMRIDLTYYSALAALLVSFYWGLRWTILTGRLIISQTGEIHIDWSGAQGHQSETPGSTDLPSGNAEPDAMPSAQTEEPDCCHADALNGEQAGERDSRLVEDPDCEPSEGPSSEQPVAATSSETDPCEVVEETPHAR